MGFNCKLNIILYIVLFQKQLLTWYNMEHINANNSLLTVNSSLSPANNILLSANSSLLPANSSLLPANSSLSPANSILLPANSSLLPANSSLSPANSSLLPANSSLLPANSSLLSANSSLLSANSSLLTANSSFQAAIPASYDSLYWYQRFFNAYLVGIITIIGCVSNCLIVIVMNDKTFKKTTLSVYFPALAISDTGKLITAAFNQMYKGECILVFHILKYF